MATRSTIAIELSDGSVRQVYCHWDGYPSHNGKLLQLYYTDEKKILELVSHGDMSSLGEEVGEKHIFGKSPNKKWTEYYGRDRGEDGVEMGVYSSYEDYEKNGRSEAYNYIFRKGSWFVDGAQLAKAEQLVDE